MQGVYRERRRYEPTWSNRSGELKKHYKHQHRIQNMNEHVCNVMGGGIQSEELENQHVRQPSERLPIGVRCRRKRRYKTVPSQPAKHQRILVNMTWIIEIDEVILTYAGVREDINRN